MEKGRIRVRVLYVSLAEASPLFAKLTGKLSRERRHT